MGTTNPTVAEAFRISRRNTGPKSFPQWFEDAVSQNVIVTHGMGKFGVGEVYVEVMTPRGVMEGKEGDYIVRTVSGQIYPCNSSVIKFIKSFEDGYEREIPKSHLRGMWDCYAMRLATSNDEGFWNLTPDGLSVAGALSEV